MPSRPARLIAIIFTAFLVTPIALAAAPPSGPPPLTATMMPLGKGYGEAPPPVLPPSVDDRGFISALHDRFLLTPNQIRMTKRIQSSLARAIATPGAGAPKPMIRTVRVPLAAGSSPPVLHLAAHNVTTLVFEDRSGEPWPVTRVFTTQSSGIVASIVGDQQSGTKSTTGKKTKSRARPPTATNIVALLPTTSELVGRNVVVTLQGLDVPLAFTVTAGDGTVDYRDDIEVPAYGPNSAPSTAGPLGMPSIGRPGVQEFLDGIPPAKARHLRTNDASVSAWYWQREMYVRTHDTLVTPSMYHRASPSGAYVYVLRPAPILSVVHDGAIENVRVSNLPPGYAYVSDQEGANE